MIGIHNIDSRESSRKERYVPNDKSDTGEFHCQPVEIVGLFQSGLIGFSDAIGYSDSSFESQSLYGKHDMRLKFYSPFYFP